MSPNSLFLQSVAASPSLIPPPPPAGSHVRVQFAMLSLHPSTANCSLNYLEVREAGGGVGAVGPVVRRYCPGSQVPPALTSRGGALQLQLQVAPHGAVRFSASFNNVSTGEPYGSDDVRTRSVNVFIRLGLAASVWRHCRDNVLWTTFCLTAQLSQSIFHPPVVLCHVASCHGRRKGMGWEL